MWDLKSVQMNVQRWLIREDIIDKFELDHNIAEAIKNICGAHSEAGVDPITVGRWLKKYRSGWKNSDY